METPPLTDDTEEPTVIDLPACLACHQAYTMAELIAGGHYCPCDTCNDVAESA